MWRIKQQHRSAPLQYTPAFIDVKRVQSFPARGYKSCATIGYSLLNVTPVTNRAFGFIQPNYLRSHVNLMPRKKTNSWVANERAWVCTQLSRIILKTENKQYTPIQSAIISASEYFHIKDWVLSCMLFQLTELRFIGMLFAKIYLGQ